MQAIGSTLTAADVKEYVLYAAQKTERETLLQ
jgi:hypothetical protein